MKRQEQPEDMKSCPSDAAWSDVAAGHAEPEKSLRLLEHASGCSRCARVLADYVRAFSGEATKEEDAMLESLTTTEDRWQKQMAVRLAAAAHRRRYWSSPWWAAAAALIIAVAGAAWWIQLRSRNAPLELLARAYSKRRNVELRIGSANFSSWSGERGPSPDRPAELSEAQAAIQRHLDAGAASDPYWLHARGRAALLEWQYEPAIRTLRLALDLEGSAQPHQKAEILTDLATAYFERAVALDRAIDYSLAADLLGQALQSDGSFAPVFYNRAIVYEKEFLYPNAVSDWKRYLELDPRGAWADDARRRLAEIDKKLQSSFAGENATADLVESRLRRSMESGLIAPDAKALADRLVRENDDHWLADALTVSGGRAVETLGAMTVSHMATRMDRFPAELQNLDALSLEAGTPAPLRVWLDFERLFRVTHSPRVGECIGGLDVLVATCRRDRYFWFLTQILLERSTCEAANDDLAASERSDLEAASIAHEHALPVAELRALGFLSIRLTNQGRYREAAAMQHDALALYWSRPYPVPRAQEIYNNMDWVNEGLGRLFSAKAAAQAAAELAHQSGVPIHEAVNRARWAGYAERVGLREEAYEQYNRSRTLFDSLQDNDSTRQYRAFAEAFVAEATARPEALGRFESAVLRSADLIVSVPYLRTMAILAERNGDLRQATARLLEAVRRMTPEKASQTAPGETKRWRLELQRTFRELVWSELQQGDVTDAYSHWQQLLADDGALKGYRPDKGAMSTAGIPATLVTFARLKDKYGMWVRTSGALEFHWVEGSAPDIDVLARSFSALCAQPYSNWSSMRVKGDQLRSRLLDRAILVASEAAPLLIQPDGELARLPWAALPMLSGLSMGEHFMIAVAPLPFPESSPPRLGDLTIGRALFIGATVIDPSFAADFPPLPGIAEEIVAAREAFPNSDSLEGARAIVANINLLTENAGVLHFAGHAVVKSGGPRLLVAPDSSSVDADEMGGLWNLRNTTMQRLGLAVLSACSTARYEEDESPEPQDLAGILLVGGVRQVLAAHWNVDSAAASRLMQTFYRGLAKSRIPVEALRDAVREVRRQSGWENPYFWAAFSLFVQQ